MGVIFSIMLTVNKLMINFPSKAFYSPTMSSFKEDIIATQLIKNQ